MKQSRLKILIVVFSILVIYVPAGFALNTTSSRQTSTKSSPFIVNLKTSSSDLSKQEIETYSAKGVIIVRVTGHQWFWEYEFVDSKNKGIRLVSSSNEKTKKAVAVDLKKLKEGKTVEFAKAHIRPLVLPVNRRILFVISSKDVIHSFWIPQFGIKKDAIPKHYTKAWIEVSKPGTYYGQCAELCGKYHAYMNIVVKIVSQKDFEAWRKKMKSPGN